MLSEEMGEIDIVNKRVVDFMNGMRMSLWIQGLHTYVKEKDFKLICVTDDDAEKTYHFTIPDDIVNMRFSMRGHGVLFGSNPGDEKNSVRLNLEINVGHIHALMVVFWLQMLTGNWWT